jgi:hypothetical protein
LARAIPSARLHRPIRAVFRDAPIEIERVPLPGGRLVFVRFIRLLQQIGWRKGGQLRERTVGRYERYDRDTLPSKWDSTHRHWISIRGNPSPGVQSSTVDLAPEFFLRDARASILTYL